MSLKFQVTGPPLPCGAAARAVGGLGIAFAVFLGAGFFAAAFFAAAFFAGVLATTFLAAFLTAVFLAAFIPLSMPEKIRAQL
jgi:hypothetical protein